jgi:hypothetical protein
LRLCARHPFSDSPVGNIQKNFKYIWIRTKWTVVAKGATAAICWRRGCCRR